MERNLDRRVEALVQIIKPEHKETLNLQLEGYFASDVDRWELDQRGGWRRININSEGKSLISIHARQIENSK